MKICLVNRDFSFHGTGVTRIATEVSRELEKRGHEVIRVSTGGMECSLYAYAWHTAVGVKFRLPKADVYHALATLEALWLPRDRSVATYLDLFTSTNPDRAGAGMGYSRWKLEIGKRYFAFGAKMAAKCRYCVCISDKTKEDVMKHIGINGDKLKVIRLGIQEDLEPMDIYHRFKPKGLETLVIGTLGQLDKRKRINLLIEALKKTNLNAQLLIAGKGPDKPMLQALAGDDERIKFLGLIPSELLSDFYNSLDVFVFPTGIEGYGLPPVEAMACRKPTIILKDAIIPEDVRSRCVAVDDLTEALRNDGHLEQLCKVIDYDSNYEFAKQHKWSNCVNEYIKLYKEIA